MAARQAFKKLRFRMIANNVVFSSVPDGINHVSETLVNSKAKQLQIKTTNSSYSKVGG
jgi:hypothetical protein